MSQQILSYVMDRLDELKTHLRGQIFSPKDPQYEEVRLAWNRAVDHHPVLVVMAANAADVAETVRFARQYGLGLAVQSTGHGPLAAANDAVLLLTSQLKGIQVDPSAGTARIEAGLKWGEVLAQTQRFGLAPLLGSSSDVGVVGYTLGGGLGWLGRKYGLAADSVLAFELVDPAGEARQASPTENPDLFWALRGGGGGFAVVTAMHIRLYPVSMVYAGNLYYPAEMATGVMQRYREWIANAPDDLTTSMALMNYPPMSQVPETLRGKSFVIVRGCYAGSLEAGDALLQFWRGWRQPLIDAFQPLPFSQVDQISNDPVDPMPTRGASAWLRELADETIQALIRFGLPQAAPPVFTMVTVRHAGGAIARMDPESSAFGHRQAPLVLGAVGVTPTLEAYAQVGAHAAAMLTELQPALAGGVYMNFVDGEDARRRTPDGYPPETFRRLQSLKKRIDPDNLLRFGFDFHVDK